MYFVFGPELNMFQNVNAQIRQQATSYCHVANENICCLCDAGLKFQECPSGLRSVRLQTAGLHCQFVSVPYQYRKTRGADREDPPLQSLVKVLLNITLKDSLICVIRGSQSGAAGVTSLLQGGALSWVHCCRRF
jgi:hypothetical protein